MKIIAYTYHADVHCPACTGAALRSGAIHIDNNHPLAIPVKQVGIDEYGIPLNVVDSEGNLIHPVFSADENTGFYHCGECFADLK
jgi:hypothetical protein